MPEFGLSTIVYMPHKLRLAPYTITHPFSLSLIIIIIIIIIIMNNKLWENEENDCDYLLIIIINEAFQ